MPTPTEMKRSKETMSHTEYLISQGLPALLNDLVEATVASKPTDALAFACKWLENKRNTKLVGHNLFDFAGSGTDTMGSISTLAGMGGASGKPVAKYGKHLFKGAVADEFLAEYGLTSADLEDPSWMKDKGDAVASAVMAWAKACGADTFTHWFQPLGSSGLRPGQTGQVHNSFYCFKKDGSLDYDFDGKMLIKGETDGSSYPNGGLRITHTAGGYTLLDPTSPIFLRGDTVFIPACFVTWHGHSMDEKTPLLRAQQAMSAQGVRLMKNLGYKIDGLQANIGLEQEFFLIPRKAYYNRLDLQLTGRTVMGRQAPRGQELCDHYMASFNPIALACMQELQTECYKLGIPMRTRHREVAPNQYECAPLFGIAQTQIDQNLMVMQMLEEVSAKHGLACLLHEKPFAGINGSGKHNNWSLGTPQGINLFNPVQLTKASGNSDIFPIVMAAMVKAIDSNGDLMRMAIASPGNDFRLGACEAPPAIISTYLGDDMVKYLEGWMAGDSSPYTPKVKTMGCGVDSIGEFTVPAEDRNRTSPFPYGGNRFEFRAVGSSQNVSMVNTVLCALVADSFKQFSDAIESGKNPKEVATAALKEHWRVIFNGNGYGEDWPTEAVKRGLFKCDSGVEAISRLSEKKNIDLFDSLKIMTPEETNARAVVMYGQYTGTVEMEAKCMIDMINQKIIPSVKACGVGSVADLEGCIASVQAKLDEIAAASDPKEMATIARVLRLETMEKAREVCDKTEDLVPAEHWNIATYKELLFLDANQGSSAEIC